MNQTDNKLSRILEDVYRMGHTGATLGTGDWEVLRAGVEKTLRDIMLEIIGETEPDEGLNPDAALLAYARNNLRATQRAALNKVISDGK